MPRRQPFKARQTQPGVIPEHFRRRTRRVVKASESEECCWRPAARASPGGHRIPVIRGHLPARDHGVMDPAPAPHMIRINGHLGATVLSAFPALAPQHHGAHTVLTGLLDRSALYGVLAEIEALGLGPARDPKARPGPHITRTRSPPLTVTATTVGYVGFATSRCRSHDQCPRARPARRPSPHARKRGTAAHRLPAPQLDGARSMDRMLLVKNAVSTVKTIKTFEPQRRATGSRRAATLLTIARPSG